MDVEREVDRLWATVSEILERLRELEGSGGAPEDAIGFWVDDGDFDEDDSEY